MWTTPFVASRFAVTTLAVFTFTEVPDVTWTTCPCPFKVTTSVAVRMVGGNWRADKALEGTREPRTWYCKIKVTNVVFVGKVAAVKAALLGANNVRLALVLFKAARMAA